MTDYLKQLEALPTEGRSILRRRLVRLAGPLWEVDDGYGDHAYLRHTTEDGERLTITADRSQRLVGDWRGSRDGVDLRLAIEGQEIEDLASTLLTYQPLPAPVWLCQHLWRMTQTRWSGRVGGHDISIDQTPSTGDCHWTLEYEPTRHITGYNTLWGSEKSLDLALAAALAAPLKLRDGARRLLADALPADEVAPPAPGAGRPAGGRAGRRSGPPATTPPSRPPWSRSARGRRRRLPPDPPRIAGLAPSSLVSGDQPGARLRGVRGARRVCFHAQWDSANGQPSGGD